MHIPQTLRFFALPVAALLIVACAGGGSAGWTYAPIGPSPAASAPASGEPGSPAASPGGSPAGSPAGSPGGSPAASSGAGTTVDLTTPADNVLAFVPAEFSVPAGASVTVNYLNDSNLPHNAEFFAGQDSSSESLGITEDVTGPGATTSVTFTSPSEPGDYFFWCRIHGDAMVGSYTVE